MTTVRISGSAVPALFATSAQHSPSSRRGMLRRKLEAAQGKKQGSGWVYLLEVELKYQKEFALWVTDAKTQTKDNSAKDALRRLAKSLNEAQSLV